MASATDRRQAHQSDHNVRPLLWRNALVSRLDGLLLGPCRLRSLQAITAALGATAQSS
jgi:hypothetical protein